MRVLSLLVLLWLLWLSGCQTSLLLRGHHREMQRLAYGDLRPAEQFDGLAYLLVEVLGGAAEQPSANKSLRYLQKFSQQNQAELETVVSGLQSWLKTQPAPARALFLTRALGQPYARELLELVPRTQQLMKERRGTVGALQKALLLFRLREMLKS